MTAPTKEEIEAAMRELTAELERLRTEEPEKLDVFVAGLNEKLDALNAVLDEAEGK